MSSSKRTRTISDFRRTAKQVEATKVLASRARHCALIGGSRSGKTFLLVRSVLIRAAKEPNSNHAIFRQKFNAAKRSIFNETLPKVLRLCFPDLGVIWNKTDFFIELPNKSKVHVGGLDDKERTEKILGLEFSTLYFNECSQVSYTSAQMAITRLAERNGLRKKVYYDLNPSTKAHWSYLVFIKKLNPSDDEPLKDPENYAHFFINPVDNLDNIDPEYLSLLESMPESERVRFLEGKYQDQSDGQVYRFKQDRDVTPNELRPGTVFLGMDFNVDPMTCVVVQVVNGRILAVDEVYLRNSDTYQMADTLKSKGYSGGWVIPDSTARNRKTSGQSDLDILKQQGFRVMDTFNPYVLDRVNNINRLLTAERLKIDPKCKKLINDLEQVVWKDNKLDQKGDAKLLTKISDALGYACWYLDPIAYDNDNTIRSYKRRL